MLTALHYSPDTGWQEVTDLSVISSLCERSGERVWAEADVSTLTDGDVATIAEEFGLHELAVEDAKSMRERPKLEEYERHLFVVVHELETRDGQLEPVQIACFVGTRYVLVLHAGARSIMAEAKRRLRATKTDVWGGSTYLMHTLLDTIVDDYQHIADHLEEEIESVEEELLEDPRSPAQTRLYTVKQRLARFRRYVLPVSRMLSVVTNQGSFAPSIAIAEEHFGAYFRDVHDHTLRVADQVRNVEDLTDALLDLVRVEATNAQNEVTKRLTGWAAIIAVPTYIASVYGMNYQLVPRHQALGFWFALGLMASSAIGLYVYFRRRGWI
jgi:magnesium transporter